MLSSGRLIPWALLLFFSNAFATLNLDVPTCTVPSFNWTSNQHGQGPCTIAAALESVCRGANEWEIPEIPPGQAYNGPPAGAGDPCQCSTVVYSLISACSLCQGGLTTSWGRYSQNCTGPQLTIQSFIVSIPDGYSIPTWAYLDVTSSSFSPDQAELIASEKQPDITKANATSSSPSDGTSSSSSDHSGSKAGAIAGGVVGGIALVCIVIGAAVYFYRKKKNATSHDQTIVDVSEESKPAYLLPTPYYPPSTGEGGAPVRPYDPSDPSTHPSSNSLSPLYYQHKHTMSDSTYRSGTTSPGFTATSGQSIISGGHAKSHSDGTYKGIPEV